MYVKYLIVTNIRTEERQGSHVSRRHYSYPNCWTIQTLPVNESSDPLQSEKLLQKRIKASQSLSRTVWLPWLGMETVGTARNTARVAGIDPGYACMPHTTLQQGNMHR